MITRGTTSNLWTALNYCRCLLQTVLLPNWASYAVSSCSHNLYDNDTHNVVSNHHVYYMIMILVKLFLIIRICFLQRVTVLSLYSVANFNLILHFSRMYVLIFFYWLLFDFIFLQRLWKICENGESRFVISFSLL